MLTLKKSAMKYKSQSGSMQDVGAVVIKETPIQAEVSIFKGLTASFYGDSLTEVNGHYTKGYHQWIKELLELASCNNYGVSSYTTENVYNKVVSVNDTADIVFVMCGVNDQTHSLSLGTISDSTKGTTYGNLNLLCGKLKEKYPTKLIVFITPHYQTRFPHNSGITSYEVSKAIKEVCEKYAIPVYDNFVLSGIYETNLSYWTTDNCHWNDKAHEMVGRNLAKFMVDTFRYYYGYVEPSEPSEPDTPDTPSEQNIIYASSYSKTDGGFINTDGSVRPFDNYAYSDKIPLPPSTAYEVYSNVAVVGAYYDSNGEWISTQQGGPTSWASSYEFTSPENCAYFVFNLNLIAEDNYEKYWIKY